jgi:hypothetical protein
MAGGEVMGDHVFLNEAPLPAQFTNSFAECPEEARVIVHTLLCRLSTSKNTTSRLAYCFYGDRWHKYWEIIAEASQKLAKMGSQEFAW